MSGPPEFYRRAKEQYPDLFQSYEALSRAAQEAGPLDPKVIVRLDTDPIPSFVPRRVDEDSEWRTNIDHYGFTVRTSKRQSVGPTVYYYLDGPVQGPRDWEEMKRRFDASDPRRRPRATSRPSAFRR